MQLRVERGCRKELRYFLRPGNCRQAWGPCASFLSAVWVVLSLTACGKPRDAAPEVTVRQEIAPNPARVGPANITLYLKDAAARPLGQARITVEANMSHPGMSPVFGEAGEVAPGRYRAHVEFTMAGDWAVLAHITLADGRKIERQFELRVEVKDIRAN